MILKEVAEHIRETIGIIHDNGIWSKSVRLCFNDNEFREFH